MLAGERKCPGVSRREIVKKGKNSASEKEQISSHLAGGKETNESNMGGRGKSPEKGGRKKKDLSASRKERVDESVGWRRGIERRVFLSRGGAYWGGGGSYCCGFFYRGTPGVWKPPNPKGGCGEKKGESFEKKKLPLPVTGEKRDCAILRTSEKKQKNVRFRSCYSTGGWILEKWL